MRKSLLRLALLALALQLPAPRAHAADATPLERVVNETIAQLMRENDVPGMAVAVTVQGKRTIFNYGVASRATGQPVTGDTLFETGSISKTFTGTLAGLAQARGMLSLSDEAARYLPALANSSVGKTSLIDLGTYAAGGLPLHFPPSVTSEKSMLAWFRNWRPTYPAGSTRIYSNPSIGLFGLLAANSLGKPFDDAMEQTLIPALGLKQTFIRVPREQQQNFAFGHAKDDKPLRVAPGILGIEAYGIKTTAADLIKVVEAHIDSSGLDEPLRRAIAATQTGYYSVGDMTQGLGWEMYAWPVELPRVLAGSSDDMIYKPNKVTRPASPLAPRKDMLINKTGSINGFGAYVAFVPVKRIGIVMLANKNYPNAARIRAAHRILTAVEGQAAASGER